MPVSLYEQKNAHTPVKQPGNFQKSAEKNDVENLNLQVQTFLKKLDPLIDRAEERIKEAKTEYALTLLGQVINSLKKAKMNSNSLCKTLEKEKELTSEQNQAAQELINPLLRFNSKEIADVRPVLEVIINRMKHLNTSIAVQKSFDQAPSTPLPLSPQQAQHAVTLGQKNSTQQSMTTFSQKKSNEFVRKLDKKALEITDNFLNPHLKDMAEVVVSELEKARKASENWQDGLLIKNKLTLEQNEAAQTLTILFKQLNHPSNNNLQLLMLTTAQIKTNMETLIKQINPQTSLNPTLPTSPLSPSHKTQSFVPSLNQKNPTQTRGGGFRR